jgi:hypothetical protein
MGEAKRRDGRSPTATELVRGWIYHVSDASPRPIRTYVRIVLPLVAAMVVLLLGLLIVAAVVVLLEWLIWPPSITLVLH